MREELSVAQIVDKSAILIDKVMRGKNVPENLLPHLYLSFASFYMFYGKDAVNTIFSVYKDSDFFLANKSRARSAVNLENPDSIRKIENSIKDEILISKSDDANLVFHDTVHEINHQINSKRNRVVYDKDSNQYFSRLGMQLMGLESRNIKNNYLNEMINSYESEEVENLMFQYIYPHREEVQNLKIRALLNQLNPDIHCRKHSYTFLQEQASSGFIFNHKKYYCLLKNQLFNGDVEAIKSDFEDYFQVPFDLYSNSVDQLGSNHDKVKKKNSMLPRLKHR